MHRIQPEGGRLDAVHPDYTPTEQNMKTLFQITIEHLLKSHNLLEDFHRQESFHVRFEKTGYQRLVIERHSKMISVAHYFEQNGDLVADPDVE
ncbi:MAG: hypothetical protein C3F07_03810, partial [Anaerolineales bacterium]